MYRFKSAMRLFTASFGSFAPSRRSIRRKILPPEFSRNVVRLECESTAKRGVCEVFVIGTIHDYPKSGVDVKNLVNFVKPQVNQLLSVQHVCRNRMIVGALAIFLAVLLYFFNIFY